jgi:hypothetical protein
MRMRPVRHFSRVLYQVSVCLITSARHSQVRSPNTRTSQHIVAGSVRFVHICSSKSWLTRTNATGRNALQNANTLIPRKQSCSRYATIADFSCTDTQADGANSEGIPKRLFFFLRCRDEQRQQNNKSFVPTSPGVARDSFFLFFYLFIFHLIYLINLISSIQ